MPGSAACEIEMPCIWPSEGNGRYFESRFRSGLYSKWCDNYASSVGLTDFQLKIWRVKNLRHEYFSSLHRSCHAGRAANWRKAHGSASAR